MTLANIESHEFEFAKVGKYLSTTPICEDNEAGSFVVCLLQYCSQKPWITLDLSDEKFLTCRREWDMATGQFPETRFQFLTEIKSILNSNEPSNQIGVLLTDEKNSNTFVRLCQLFYSYYKITFKLKIVTQSNDPGELIWGDLNCMEEIVIYKSCTENVQNSGFCDSYQLVADLKCLHPNPIEFAEELIDHLTRFKIFDTELVGFKDFDFENQENTMSHYEHINNKLTRLQNCVGFQGILELALPSQLNTYIGNYLTQIENEIEINSKGELTCLKNQLITRIKEELFYPIQEQIIKQMELYFNRASEIGIKNEGIEKEVERLKNFIGNCNEQKNLCDEKVQEMKESRAFYSYVQSIQTDPSKEFIQQIRNLLSSNIESDCNISSMTLEQIVNSLDTNTETISSDLYKGIRKNSIDDKKLLLDTLKEIVQEPGMTNESEQVLTIRGNHVILSAIYQNIITKLDSYKNTEDLQILLTGNFIIDRNLEDEKYFSGKNLTIIADNIMVINNVKFVVSGLNGKPHTTPARDGACAGYHGLEGVPGEAGKSSGNVYIEALDTISNLNGIDIICNGGNGANGQVGGNGSNGSNGTDGIDGEEIPEPSWWKSYTDQFHYINRGTKAQKGGCPGKGGTGGLGGQGGSRGKGSIIQKGTVYKEFEGENGQQGKDGKKGDDGKSGENGKHGRDFSWAKRGFGYPSVKKIGVNLCLKTFRNQMFTGYEYEEGPNPEFLRNETKVLRQNCTKQARLNTNTIQPINLTRANQLQQLKIGEGVTNVANVKNKVTRINESLLVHAVIK